MTKTVQPNQLESLQAYDFIWKNTKKYFEPQEEQQVRCIHCESVIPACDQDISGTCVDCWLEDHPIK